MGYGDEIMAAGQAQYAADIFGGPVAILSQNGKPRWSDVWLNNPAISTPEDHAQHRSAGTIINGPNRRPYIDRWDSWGGQPMVIFSRWRARDKRGTIYFDGTEMDRIQELGKGMGDFVVIEPGLSASRPNPNKQWPRERYQDVVESMPKVRFVQIGPEPTGLLRGVEHIKTPCFRWACEALAAAVAYIGPEGGLHHASAAVGTRAVVIFGGHTDPQTTGYDDHKNLYVPGPDSPCGRWAPCGHCREAMAGISVDQAVMALKEILR